MGQYRWINHRKITKELAIKEYAVAIVETIKKHIDSQVIPSDFDYESIAFEADRIASTAYPRYIKRDGEMEFCEWPWNVCDRYFKKSLPIALQILFKEGYKVQ